MAEVIQAIGAYAGLAAIVGLGVLSALYFSQARDVRRLREWAGRAPDRPEASRGRPAREVEERPAGAPHSAGQAGNSDSDRAPAPGPGGGGSGAVAAAAAAGGSPAVATSAPGGSAAPARPAPAESPSLGAGAPGRNGPSAASQTQHGARSSVRPSAPAASGPGRSAPARAGAAARTTAGERAGTGAGRSSLPYVALAVVGVLIVVGAGAFAVGLIGGREEPDPAAEPAPAGGGQETAAAVDPASVTFSVLNGTGVDGLAKQLADELEAAGYRRGNVTNAPEQKAESVVLYAPNARADGQAVARELDVQQLEEADPQSRSLAGDASVIVLAGADQTR